MTLVMYKGKTSQFETIYKTQMFDLRIVFGNVFVTLARVIPCNPL